MPKTKPKKKKKPTPKAKPKDKFPKGDKGYKKPPLAPDVYGSQMSAGKKPKARPMKKKKRK